MGAEVTDPALLAQLNGPAADASPAPGKEVTDPALLAKLNHGASGEWEAPNDKLPFGDQVSLSQADNFEEKELYMQHRYGTGNVSREWGEDGNPTLLVKTTDGKTFRIGGGKGESGFVAQVAADAPKITGAVIGAVAGAPAGPVGMVAGAGVGAMIGKEGTEAIKGLYGNYDKTPEQGIASFGEAAQQGVEGEMAGQSAGKVIAKTLTAHLPKFITGATDESIAMTKKAHAAGARPPFASMSPDLMKLRRIEVVAEKLTGKYAKQDEVNLAFVRSELSDKLKAAGMPQSHVDAFLEEINGPEYAVSHNAVGNDLKASVRAHIDGLNAGIAKTAAIADSHIDAQLENVRKVIDSSKHANLTGDVGAMIESAHKDFKEAAKTLYDRALTLAGSEKIVPTEQVSQEAKKIVALIQESAPTQVQGIIRDMSKLAKRPLSAEDAILMKEFGIELPKDGKMSLQAAQRLRTILRDKAGSGEFTHNTTQHDYGQLASAVDDAIQDAAGDAQARPAIQALNEADAFWKRNVPKFNDAKIDNLMKQIKSGAPPDPEKLVGMLTQIGGTTRTAALKRMIGEDAWKRVQSVHLQKYMSRFEETGFDGKKQVDGLKLLRNLEDGDGVEQIRTIHGQDAVTEMRELATMIAARRGKLDPAVLTNGGPKAALQSMREHEARLDDFMKNNALAILADPKMTGEEAYQYLARPGAQSESRLLGAAKLFGENSPQMAGLRQAALEEVARNSSIHAINLSGNRAIANALKQYTPTQRELLFPDGLAADMNHVSDVIQFMFPFKSGVESDSGMAGMHSGSVMEMPVHRRLFTQTVAAVTRFIALHPVAARWIVTGREEGEEAWMRRTAQMFHKMMQVATMTAQAPDNNATDQAPPTPVAGPPTLQ